MREIYLDNAATTRVCEPAIEAMAKVMRDDYGNPSSLHGKGIRAEQYIKEAKAVIAKSLKCDPKEIIFTSGGTESNNLALFGAAEAKKRQGKHIIASPIEHASVYNPLIRLEELGYEVTYLPVDGNGLLKLDALKDALRKDTILVSCMMVNNEIGAVEPIREIAGIVHGFRPDILFHVDAIQAYGKIPFVPSKLGIDLLSVSGHKLHGPKGSGFLYKRDKVRILPEILGGGQQNNMRSGTENVPAIAGLGAAVSDYFANQKEYIERMYECKKTFLTEVEMMEYAHPNAVFAELSGELSLDERVRKTAPHILSISFDSVRSEVLLHALEDYGIYVSSGSACSSNHPAISGTLKAIGVADKYLDSTLRFSFCKETAPEDIKEACNALRELVPKLSRFTVK
ncbi:MAG: cysteine desulfurase [Lachnospiraceae bacterium]|nr:cysteine desulfurase [Lachnospiraceae bacterium]